MAPYIWDTLCVCAPTSLPSTADRWYDHTAVCMGQLEYSGTQDTVEDCIIIMECTGVWHCYIITNYFTSAEGIVDGLDIINSEIKSECKYVVVSYSIG